jgi:hypothetical protein
MTGTSDPEGHGAAVTSFREQSWGLSSWLGLRSVIVACCASRHRRSPAPRLRSTPPFVWLFGPDGMRRSSRHWSCLHFEALPNSYLSLHLPSVTIKQGYLTLCGASRWNRSSNRMTCRYRIALAAGPPSRAREIQLSPSGILAGPTLLPRWSVSMSRCACCYGRKC